MKNSSAVTVRELIESGRLDDAIHIYRCIHLPTGNRFIHETSAEDLRECLATPLPVFSFCSADELRELRVRMAMALIEGRRLVLEPDARLPWQHRMTPKAAVHNFFASLSAQRNVSSWRNSGVVLRVRIINSGDGGCSVCQKAVGDYALADLPSIPIHNCENLNVFGCRCIAVGSKFKGIDP
jgi:hypothetical protein